MRNILRSTRARTLLSVASAFALAGGLVLAQPGPLLITVDYQGPGTVSQDHQLSVFVFDDPNMSADSLPIWTGQLADNQKTLSAGSFDASTIWVAVTFDETGGYDPFAGPPPSGSPFALYSTDPTGMPTGVALHDDQETEIAIAFDGTLRMP